MSRSGEWETVAIGVKRKIHPPGKQLMLMEVEFEKGGVGDIHSHPHEQYTYCLAGKFEFTLGENTHILNQGETLYIPGNVAHGVVALESGVLLDTFSPLREDLL
ncbi:cupin domain-containing protein [Halalkalibacter akibai]|uniref:Cupin type-2 domain-containing protein n=1 Tax=Halalkalibacter akibai (strain ATCC 43226 / DSM 21942 / CIP 109018 / JCM 9157 / 1139) TaxID=1236973 RepID=W4QT24_HALA3|nr:cupin domain-containing protein [Halalkalibacter akibai]GAE34788.1 hypothetical protein JCM9157_1868 [Halalkalibacter akibai JCM 9157]